MDIETRALDEFGALLIKRVRDKAILEWDMILDGRMKDAGSQLIRQMVSSLDAEQMGVLHQLIPRIVDTTLHHLLWTLEQNKKKICIVVQTEEGEVPNLAKVSDSFPGELYNEQGWIARFTEQRYYDILEGLEDIEA